MPSILEYSSQTSTQVHLMSTSRNLSLFSATCFVRGLLPLAPNLGSCRSTSTSVVPTIRIQVKQRLTLKIAESSTVPTNTKEIISFESAASLLLV